MSMTTPALARNAPTIGLANLARSEWTKLRSVRSAVWTILAVLLATAGTGAFTCARWVAEFHAGQQDRLGFDAALTSLTGIYLAQVAVGALGVLTITSEYSTGMIRASLSAVPQRRALLAVKGGVFAAAALAGGELVSFATFGIGQAILHQAGAGLSLSDGAALRAAFGGGLYLTAVGLLGYAFGALVRNSAGALAAFFGLLFASTAVIDLLPTQWRNDAIPYMPANAGSQIITTIHGPNALSPWAGIGVFTCYVAVVMTAALVLAGRDTP
jgi:ABC-2 type transport system permease protein